MTPEVVIAALGALAVVLAAVALRQGSQRRALATRLAATSANLQKYGPLDELDAEIARRRMTLQTESARAAHEIDEARRRVELAVARLRAEAEVEESGVAARLQLARDELARTEAQLAQAEVALELEETGVYAPKFHLADARQYGEALDLVREAQKELVRRKQLLEEIGPAVAPAVQRLGRFAVQAFNADAAALVAAVGDGTFEAALEKLHRRFDQTNRVLAPVGLRIARKYLDLKAKELALADDHRHAADATHRTQAAIKATMRREEDARREADRTRRRPRPTPDPLVLGRRSTPSEPKPPPASEPRLAREPDGG